MAHLGCCIDLARRRGHRVIGLVYDQALSGGFITSGLIADACYALPEAEIRVMRIPAMARVTKLSEELLTELSRANPVFAPGVGNYVRMGGVRALWEGDLAGRAARRRWPTRRADDRARRDGARARRPPARRRRRRSACSTRLSATACRRRCRCSATSSSGSTTRGWARRAASAPLATRDGARAAWRTGRAHDLPLVVTRQPARRSGAGDALALGLPAPLRWERRRLALRVPRAGDRAASTTSRALGERRRRCRRCADARRLARALRRSWRALPARRRASTAATAGSC